MAKTVGRDAGPPARESSPRSRLGILGIAAGLATCVVASTVVPGAFGAPRRRGPPPSTGSGSAAASTPSAGYVAPSAPAQPETTHREGDYGGVDPDRAQGSDAPAKPRPRHVPAKGTLSWVGFELKDGGSEVFFQSPGAFEVQQHVEGGQLVVELSNLYQLGANAWRPIDTHYFDNPLARIEARRVGAARATKTAPAHAAGIEVRLTFKTAGDAKEAALRSQQDSDGYYYAYLSFAGTAAPQDATTTLKDPEK